IRSSSGRLCMAGFSAASGSLPDFVDVERHADAEASVPDHRARHRTYWTVGILGRARPQLPCVTLQHRVSEALEAVPRGREPLGPGEYFRRAVLSALPDIEAMELVERFFEVGRVIVGTSNPLGIFLAGCRECLADWEVHATSRPHLAGRAMHETDGFAHVGNETGFAHVGNETVDEAPSLPTWANREGGTSI